MGDEGLIRILANQWAAMGIPAIDRALWKQRFSIYLTDLPKLCEEAIVEGFAAWHRGEFDLKNPGRGAFFPQPAELYTLAKKVHAEIYGAEFMARATLDAAKRLPPAPMNAEDRARRRQDAIDAGLLNADGSVNMSPRRSPAPPPTERPGETPQQMAARLRAVADEPEDEAI